MITGGTFTVTIGNGVSDPVPYNYTVEQLEAASDQARKRNTLDKTLKRRWRRARNRLRNRIGGRS